MCGTILKRGQPGAKWRQIYKLTQTLEQGPGEGAMVIMMAQLDFNTAFTSTNMNEVSNARGIRSASCGYGVATVHANWLLVLSSGHIR